MTDDVDEALVVKRPQQAEQLPAEDAQRPNRCEPQGPPAPTHDDRRPPPLCDSFSNQKLTFVLNVIRRKPDADVGCRKNGDVMMPLYPEYDDWLNTF